MFITTSTILCVYVLSFSLSILIHQQEPFFKAVSKDILSDILVVYCFIAFWFVGGLSIFHSYLVCTNQVSFLSSYTLPFRLTIYVYYDLTSLNCICVWLNLYFVSFWLVISCPLKAKMVEKVFSTRKNFIERFQDYLVRKTLCLFIYFFYTGKIIFHWCYEILQKKEGKNSYFSLW